MGLHPLVYRFCGEKNTHRIGQLSVGGYVKDEFCSGSFGIVGERGALTDKVILIDISLSASIGLEAADRHPDIMNRSESVCRWPTDFGRSPFVVSRWSLAGS